MSGDLSKKEFDDYMKANKGSSDFPSILGSADDRAKIKNELENLVQITLNKTNNYTNRDHFEHTLNEAGKRLSGPEDFYLMDSLKQEIFETVWIHDAGFHGAFTNSVRKIEDSTGLSEAMADCLSLELQGFDKSSDPKKFITQEAQKIGQNFSGIIKSMGLERQLDTPEKLGVFISRGVTKRQSETLTAHHRGLARELRQMAVISTRPFESAVTTGAGSAISISPTSDTSTSTSRTPSPGI